jgi:acetolactate synthase I/II/III large subunit
MRGSGARAANPAGRGQASQEDAMDDGAARAYRGLAQALRAETDVIFGVMGHATASALVSYIEHGGQYISSRHENGAVNMAEGWARVHGGVGVASVTVGPGITQIGTGLVSASRAGTPLVVLAGDLPWSDPARHQHAFDQARFAEAAEALFVPVVSPASMAADVAEAFYLARTRRRAVVLNVPIPVQEAALPTGWTYRPIPDPGSGQRIGPDPLVVASVADRLARAERPIIVAGRGAQDPDARRAILDLADHLGALLATTLLAKGAFAAEPWDIGIAGGYSSGVGESLFAEADVVLTFGTSLHRHATRDGSLFPGADVIRVDTAPAPASPGRVGGTYVRGDAGLAARALHERLLEAGMPASPGLRTPAVRERLRTATWSGTVGTPPSDGIDPRALMTSLAGLLPDRALVVCGGGHSAGFAAQYLAPPPGVGFLFSYAFGAIGQTLGMAVGAALGTDRPVVALDGDGSLMMQIQELDTAARTGAPVLVIVMDDAAYGAELHQLTAHGHSAESSLFPERSFAAIARALGADGTTVTELGDLPEAVRAGLAARGPFVVDVRLSRSVVTDAYRRLHFKLPSEAPHLAWSAPRD